MGKGHTENWYRVQWELAGGREVFSLNELRGEVTEM